MTKKNPLVALGLRIKTARKEHSFSQEELATKLNVSAITVSRWETGKQSPDYITLCRMVELFEMPLSFLTEQGDGENPHDDLIIIFSGRTKKKSNLTSNFEIILGDIGKLNPDVLAMIHETEQSWDTLGEIEKQILSDGLSFVFSSFNNMLRKGSV
jgi:transcriptional regulator with XRE-family HTH domain